MKPATLNQYTHKTKNGVRVFKTNQLATVGNSGHRYVECFLENTKSVQPVRESNIELIK